MCSASATFLGRPNFAPVRPGSLTLQRRSLLDQLAFVLRKRSQHSDHHPPSGRRRVDTVGSKHQGHTPVGERPDCLQNMAAQAVQIPHDDCVPFPHVVKERLQTGWSVTLLPAATSRRHTRLVCLRVADFPLICSACRQRFNAVGRVATPNEGYFTAACAEADLGKVCAKCGQNVGTGW